VTCEACLPEEITWRNITAPPTYTDAQPCQTCQRLVRRWWGFWFDWPPRRLSRAVFCSERCQWRAQADQRKTDRADARRRACAQCGEVFEPDRADAQFCRPRCRQKAYRERHR
jgi:hypothetical protein